MDKMEKAIQLLRAEFGEEWQKIVQSLGVQDLCSRCGKELTSFIAYPERGEGGSSKWRGNCSPKVVEAILKYILDTKKYYRQDTSHFTLLDPMSGSGTSKAVADRFGVNSILYDLNPTPACGMGNWNALKNDVNDSADLIFFHPPYHDIIKYSGNMWGKPHEDDLSRCINYNDFIEKLNFIIKKLYISLRKDGRLAILVGDIRSNGEFHSIQSDMMKIGTPESFIVKGQYSCTSDSRRYNKPFIPIVTEYMVIFRKDNPLIIPFSWTRTGECDITKRDCQTLTWYHLIRSVMEQLGGTAELSQLYQMLENHPKARANIHYKERIRATLYEHKDTYIQTGNGQYRLNYTVV